MNIMCATSLNQLRVGQPAVVTGILGDKGLARRLLGLGLRVGTEITVLQRKSKGVVLASAGTRIALGSSIVDKLTVELLDKAGLLPNLEVVPV